MADAAAAGPALVAVDVFDTDPRSVARVLAVHGDALRDLLRDDVTVDLAALLDDIRTRGDYVYVEPAIVGYDEGDGMKYYMTIDLVGQADAARRMPFLPAPTGNYADPAGLLADWDRYATTVRELMASKEMNNRRVECPAFHCWGDHAHPEVAALAAGFVERVPAHVDALATILRDDANELRRAEAAFLLAYAPDGAALVELLVGSIRDESALVRNNVMRVLYEVAFYRPELDIPLEPVLEALDYPATSDRNKAAAVIDGLLQRPGAERLHRSILDRAGDTLLAMLRLQQPNNHNFAYSILKALAGQDLGEHDHAVWEAWLAAQRAPG